MSAIVAEESQNRVWLAPRRAPILHRERFNEMNIGPAPRAADRAARRSLTMGLIETLAALSACAVALGAGVVLYRQP
jgi:hypothetical protein